MTALAIFHPAYADCLFVVIKRINYCLLAAQELFDLTQWDHIYIPPHINQQMLRKQKQKYFLNLFNQIP